MKTLCIVLLFASTLAVCQTTTDRDSAEFTRLEHVWNDAHLSGNADALEKIQSDDLEIIVPHMAVIHKNEAVQLFRSGRIKFQKYETSDLHIRVYGNSVAVTGKMLRVRVTNGDEHTDHWRFTKLYVRTGDTWKAVSFHASEAEQE